MGHGIYVKEVYVSDVYIRDLDEKIEDAQRYVEMIREDLLVLAASTPRVMQEEEGSWEDWDSYITRRVRELVEELEETSYRLSVMRIAKSNLDMGEKDSVVQSE